jgi:hypothetical protein
VKLHIAAGLSLPLNAVTQTFAFLAMRGVGKTYAASVLAEEFSKASLPFAVLDPTGAWYGLRSSADGKAPGYPVTILGGDHGDVPLEEAAGKVIAALLADEAPQLVIDLSLFSKSAMRRFVADFAEELYRKNRNPLHLIMDEADAFCPQKPRPDEMRMLGAIDEIVRRGRIRGLGCTLVTQRSAVLNKDVLTQMEVLVALRTAHPRDRAPILEWMKVHATEEQLQQVTETLATLPLGDAWIMSAGWLDLFKRIHVRQRETFNSSATPEPGQRKIEPKKLAEVDLKILQERMAATIERAKAEDPRELRRQIGALKAELAKKPAVAAVDPAALQKAREEGRAVGYEEARKASAARELDLRKSIGAAHREITHAAGILDVDLVPAPLPPVHHSAPVRTIPHHSAPPAPVRPRRIPGEVIDADWRLAIGEKRILTACAQYPRGCTREQLTVLTGYKRSSRDTYLQRLQARGMVEVGATITATAEGISALGPDFEPLPTGDELRAYWLQKLPEGERKIFSHLVGVYPEAIAREVLEESTGYKRSSRDTYIQRLRSRQLLTVVGRGELRASDELFQEAL